MDVRREYKKIKMDRYKYDKDKNEVYNLIEFYEKLWEKSLDSYYCECSKIIDEELKDDKKIYNKIVRYISLSYSYIFLILNSTSSSKEKKQEFEEIKLLVLYKFRELLTTTFAKTITEEIIEIFAQFIDSVKNQKTNTSTSVESVINELSKKQQDVTKRMRIVGAIELLKDLQKKSLVMGDGKKRKRKKSKKRKTM